jgi:hypothetical protein
VDSLNANVPVSTKPGQLQACLRTGAHQAGSKRANREIQAGLAGSKRANPGILRTGNQRRLADRRARTPGSRRGLGRATRDGAPRRGLPSRRTRARAGYIQQRYRSRPHCRTGGWRRYRAQGLAWQWTFWINLPITVIVIPLAARHIDESFGPSASRRWLPVRKRPMHRQRARCHSRTCAGVRSGRRARCRSTAARQS